MPAELDHFPTLPGDAGVVEECSLDGRESGRQEARPVAEQREAQLDGRDSQAGAHQLVERQAPRSRGAVGGGEALVLGEGADGVAAEEVRAPRKEPEPLLIPPVLPVILEAGGEGEWTQESVVAAIVEIQRRESPVADPLG